jgi:transcription elongation factor GreA
MTAAGLERLKQNLQRDLLRLDEARDYVRDQMESNEAESLGLVEAQQQLAAIEERVEELQYLIASAQLIEHGSEAHDAVRLGDLVLLTELGSGKTRRVQLVSTAEAAGSLGSMVQISSDSPVGSRLEGCRVGDTFAVSLKQGEVRYQVTQIEENKG